MILIKSIINIIIKSTYLVNIIHAQNKEVRIAVGLELWAGSGVITRKNSDPFSRLDRKLDRLARGRQLRAGKKIEG